MEREPKRLPAKPFSRLPHEGGCSPTPTGSAFSHCSPHRSRQWVGHDHRAILNGILAVVGTGASWREMPAEYGKWETAYKRFRLWRAQGRWQRLLDALGPGPVAAHPSASSAP